MKINIYTSFNGVGLERDYNILKAIFSEHEIDFADWNNHKNFNPHIPKKCDIAFHLEIPRFDLIGLAQRNVLIPNPEWFYPIWIPKLNQFDQIFAKTHDCEQVFKELHKEVIFTSFTSLDKYKPGISKEKIFLHIAGQSLLKGTGELIEAYSKYDLPICYMTSQTQFRGKGNLISTGYLSEPDFDILLNACLIHVCPSHYEGFGHYIWEAMSTGAVVITTDAPPMNEFIQDKRFLCEWKTEYKHQSGQCRRSSVEQLANTIQFISEQSFDTLITEGYLNRQRWEENDKFFKEKILNLL